MRSILEKALIALLNEEKDKADALFHDFILERSRQIHESLRQGEDFVLDESWEQELSIDEMFSDADLADEEVVEASDEEVVADETEVSAEEETVDGDDEVEAAAEEVPAEEEEQPIEDRVSELEAELQRLAAEFDAAIGGDEDETEMVGDEPAVELPVGDEVTAEEVPAEEEEAYESLEEGIVDTLEPVTPKMGEGQISADGGKVAISTDSPAALSKPVDKRQAGEPVVVKSEEHKGFDLEQSPKSGNLKPGRNTMKKADETQSSVKKEGDKAALLNKGGDDKSAQHSLFDKKVK